MGIITLYFPPRPAELTVSYYYSEQACLAANSGVMVVDKISEKCSLLTKELARVSLELGSDKLNQANRSVNETDFHWESNEELKMAL